MTLTKQQRRRWFADRLRELGYNQRQFAELLDMKPSTLSRIISGERGAGVTEVGKLASALLTDFASVSKVLGYEPPPGTANGQGELVKVPVSGMADSAGMVRPAAKRATVKWRKPAAAVVVPELGWTCFYHPSGQIDGRAVGRLALVTAEDGRRALGILEAGWAIRPINGAPEIRWGEIQSASPIEEIRIE